jgi:hypothetical protein
VPIVVLASQPRRPFVELRVGQSVGYFLLDTGADGHVMSDWFFRAAFPEGAARGRTGQAVDFAGVPIPITVVSGLEVRWADGRPEVLDFAVGPFSRPADADGLAGIVSPQALLSEGGAVELDFPAAAFRRWARAPERGLGYSLQARTLRACPSDNRRPLLYAWAAGVEGEVLWAMMDTGSPVTAVALDASVGRRLWPRARPVQSGRGVSNAPVEARALPARVDFGGVPWEVDLAVMRLPMRDCGTGALLGMNLLARCAVTLARDRGWVRCRP